MDRPSKISKVTTIVNETQDVSPRLVDCTHTINMYEMDLSDLYPLELSSPSELLLQSSTLPRMVVWDFDLTLTTIHTWNSGIYDVSKVEELSDEYVRNELFADFDFFKETVESLITKGIKVGIASFQYDTVIKMLLDKAYGGESNNPIKCKDILGRYFIFRNKLKMIKHLAHQNDINLKECEVWFFDDDVGNIKKIQDNSRENKLLITTFTIDKDIHFVRRVYKCIFE